MGYRDRWDRKQLAGASRSSIGLKKLGGTPDPSAQAGGVRFEGSPELDRERVPLGFKEKSFTL